MGSIRTHHALPVYRPFHCLALGNALFSTLPLYQRIVNLMATVEGIGCHQALYIKKKKKKKKKKYIYFPSVKPVDMPALYHWDSSFTQDRPLCLVRF